MDSIKCPNCSRKYELPRKSGDILTAPAVPILLRCGHTFCEKCVVHGSGCDKSFKCPSCKVETLCECGRAKVKGLYPNMAILGMLGMPSNCIDLLHIKNLLQTADQRKRQSTKSPKRQCSECVKDDAVMSCLQCGISFCTHCFEVTHRSPRPLRLHQGIPLHHSEQDLSSLDCHKHNSLMEHYCVEDEKLICRVCIGEDHAEHKIISLREKSGEMSEDLLEAVQYAAPIMNQLKQHISRLDDEVREVKLETQEKAEKLIQQFLYVVGAAQSTFLYLMVEMDRISAGHVKKLLTLRDAASTSLHKVQNLMSDANMIINVENVPEPVVIDPFKTLAELKEVHKIPCIFNKVPVENSDAEKQEIEDLNISDTVLDERRFVLHFHEDSVDACKNWASIDNFCTFKYSVTCPNADDLKEATDKDESNSVSDTSSVFSENLIQIDVGMKQKLRIIQVPPANNQELVYVRWVKSPSEFYVQRAHDGKQISIIERTLKVFNIRPPHQCELLTSIRVGELCVGRYNCMWYRARVTKVVKSESNLDGDEVMLFDPSTAGVHDEVGIHFIDYGNNEQTKVSCLRCLPRNLHRIPSLAILCTLAGVCPNGDEWAREAYSTFFKMVKDRPVLMTTFSRESGRRYVDLHKPAPDEIDEDVPVSVRDALLFLNLAKYSKKQIPMSDVQLSNVKSIRTRDYLQPTILMPRSYANVTLSDFRSIHRFSVQQLDSHAEYLESLTAKIQVFANSKSKAILDPSAPFAVMFPYEGMLCLARYSPCKAWYRATIVEVLKQEKKVRVVYVDYGNEDIVELIDTLKIPDEFLKLPRQALDCKLADIRPVGDAKEWPKDANDRFVDLAADDRSLLMYIRSVKDDCYHVELFDSSDYQEKSENVLSINERLVYEGLAVGLTVRNITQFGTGPSATNEESKVPLDEPCLLKTPGRTSEDDSSSENDDGGRVFVTVTSADSPSCIYVQAVKQWSECNRLVRDLHKYFTNQKTEAILEGNFKVGDTCAVYSNLEKRWCRGKILEKPSENNFEVELFDFGRKEIIHINNVKSLPGEYKEIGVMATMCSLKHIYPAGGSQEWTTTACEVLQDMVLGKECQMFCEEEDVGKSPLPVELFAISGENETDINKELVMKGVALPRKIGMFRRATTQGQSYFELAESSNSKVCEPAATHQSPGRKSMLPCAMVRDAHRVAPSTPKKPPKSKKPCISDLVDPALRFDFPDSDETSNDNDFPLASTPAESVTSGNAANDGNQEARSGEPEDGASDEKWPVVGHDEQDQKGTLQYSNDMFEDAEAVDEEEENSEGSLKETDPDSLSNDCKEVTSDWSCSSFPTAEAENDSPALDEELPTRKATEKNASKSCTPTKSDKDESLKTSGPRYKILQPKSRIDRAKIPAPGSRFSCIVTHIEAHNVIYVRPTPMQELCPNEEDIQHLSPLPDFRPGTPCIAQYTEDNLWYRAEIVTHYQSQGLAKVFYVDYGAAEVIPIDERIRILTAEYREPRAQALQCILSDIPHPRDVYLHENAIVNTLIALIGPQTLTCQVKSVKDRIIHVDLYSVLEGQPSLIAGQLLKVLHVKL